MYDDEDEEFIDDPISLIYDDFPKDNVQKSLKIYEIEDDVDDDPIILVENPYEGYFDTEIVDLRSSDDENEEQHPTPRSGYGNKNFVIPVTFLDFYRNVKLLKKCKPLSIKVVDCDKHPWYYGCRGTSKSRVNGNCLTLGTHSNLIKQAIKVEKADEDVDVEVGNDGVNVEPLTTTQSEDDKIQHPGKLNHIVNCDSYLRKEVLAEEPRTLHTNYEKLENKLDTAKKSKDLSQVNFKRNSGLVGLTISKRDLEPNPEKLTKKKTSKKRKKENIVGKPLMKQIGVALSILGTSVTPIPEKSDDNVLNNLTKENLTNNNVTVQDLPFKSSDTKDKGYNKTVSPTRCSLKITSTTILEKLKKAKVQDTPEKTKSPKKAKKIFTKDRAVPKLSLKRRPTTENDQFYVVNSNKEPYFDGSNQLPQSTETQNGDNAVEKINHKKKVIDTYPPITPSITITVSKNAPDTPVIAEKLHQTQSFPTLPTPRSYHKKLKLKKSVLNGAPNKTIENETITSECSSTPNNQAVNVSDCSLSQIVVSQVQSLRDFNILTPNKPISETPKNSAIYVEKPSHLKLKPTKDIDTVANSSNANENELEGSDAITYEKVKKTPILQPPPGSFLQAYSTHILNNFNTWEELTRKTKPRATYSIKNKSAPKTLKETEKNATEQSRKNLPKNLSTATNNNINTTNCDPRNRDTATSQPNFNNTTIPPKTTLHITRFDSKQRLEEYLNMKQHRPNTPDNPTDTNKFPPIRRPVYNLPGNNTVILRKPPAHLQTSTHQSPGLPIQTVVNHRPVNTPAPTTRFLSPWSFPPPNTNVASNIPCSMPDINMYPGSQLYQQYYWQPTNVRHPYPPLPLAPQQERHTNLVPIRNEVADDSILGSTANGELIKRINIGMPASDSTVVNDKQKMLDTLNSAIKEQNDFTHKPCDPRTAVKNKAKPCPLSKKAKTNPVPNVEPSNGYSPPILPIPSFQTAIELVKMKQKAHNSLLSQVENMNNNVFVTNSKEVQYAHRSEIGASKRKLPVVENKNHDKTKKISIEEYKKRVSKDGAAANKAPKHKCKRKKVSKNLMVDNNQDLGYDSDATMKL